VWGEFINVPKGIIGMGHNLRRQVSISAKTSFGVECCDWIEAHGAQRRDIAGGERDSGKYNGDASEGGRQYKDLQSTDGTIRTGKCPVVHVK
jgi:hypothetical protein